MFTSPRYVRQLMTPDVLTIRDDETLSVADDVMRLGRINHLPVVDGDGRLVGILSQREVHHSALMKAFGHGQAARQRALGVLRVKDVMQSEVATAIAETSLADAASALLTRKLGCLVVTDDRRPIGILTASDFVKLFARHAA